MSNYRKSRTSNSAMSYKDPGPYVARVVGHLDPSYMGTLEVQLLSSSEVGDEDDVKAQLIRVKYASPFYGVTPLADITADNQYRNTQQSYGFWAVPPDVGTKVLVMFVEGDRSRGYWFACVPDEGMNFMVPDPRASTENTADDTPSELQGAKLPVSEYNKAISQEGTDPTQFKKPYNKDFTEILEVQGLLFDEIRGTTTSSARREVPSGVYGWSTPGPLDKRTSSPKGEQGVRESKVQYPSSRLGGSSIVMDDGDDKFIRETHAADGPPFYINKEAGEPGGDETIPQNECIRIRTRTGHQILLHNSEDLIYIANSRGTAWIELTSDGKIDVHAQDSISLMTNQDFNLTAERDINMEAGRNVNIHAAARWSDQERSVNSIPSGNVTIESYYNTILHAGTGGGNLTINSSKDWTLNVDGNIKLTASKSLHFLADHNIYIKAKDSIQEHAESSIYRKSNSNMFDVIGGTYFTQATGPINVTSQDSIFQSAEVDVNITSASNMFVQAIGGTFDLKSEGNLNIEASSPLGIKAGGTIGIDGGPNVELNSGAASGASGATPATIGIEGNTPTAPSPAPRIGKLNRVILPYVFPGATTPVPYETTVPRAPQHEPWTQHENMDPLSFKPGETDIENYGELPSLDRILTPDTFAKGNGRTSSVIIADSGGLGFGQAGVSDNARNRVTGSGGPGGPPGAGGSDAFLPYDGNGPVFRQGDFYYSRTMDGPLASIRSKRRGLSVQVAAVFQTRLQGFIDDLEDSGYEIKILYGYLRRRIRRPDGTITNVWSTHSTGGAIDINPAENGFYERRNTPGGRTITDMPVETVRRLCRRYGLGWGGDWPTLTDAMHFSFAHNEQGTVRFPAERRVPIPPNQVNSVVDTFSTTPEQPDE